MGIEMQFVFVLVTSFSGHGYVRGTVCKRTYEAGMSTRTSARLWLALVVAIGQLYKCLCGQARKKHKSGLSFVASFVASFRVLVWGCRLYRSLQL